MIIYHMSLINFREDKHKKWRGDQNGYWHVSRNL